MTEYSLYDKVKNSIFPFPSKNNNTMRITHLNVQGKPLNNLDEKGEEKATGCSMTYRK